MSQLKGQKFWGCIPNPPPHQILRHTRNNKRQQKHRPEHQRGFKFQGPTKFCIRTEVCLWLQRINRFRNFQKSCICFNSVHLICRFCLYSAADHILDPCFDPLLPRATLPVRPLALLISFAPNRAVSLRLPLHLRARLIMFRSAPIQFSELFLCHVGIVCGGGRQLSCRQT